MAYATSYNAPFVRHGYLFNNNGTKGSWKTNQNLIETKIGSAVPHYKRKIMLGENASSHYFRSTDVMRIVTPPYGTGSTKLGLKSYLFGTHFTQPGIAFSNPRATIDQRNIVLAELIGRITDAVEALASLDAIAEFAQTKHLIQSKSQDAFDMTLGLKRKITSLYHRYRSVKRGWSRFLADASGRYIEYKFGITPLISDISSAHREITSGSPLLRPTPIRASGVWDRMGGYNGGTELVGAVSFKRQSYLTSYTRFSYVVKLKPKLIGMGERWGVKAESIPGAIWEATPWSWLVDYFLNIQAFLNQWQVLHLPTVYICSMEKVRCDIQTVASPSNHPFNSVPSTMVGAVNLSRTIFERKPLTQLPVYFPTINLAGPMQGSREWNIAALVGTKFKKF